MQYDFDLVGKIGSMALIRREDADIDYNIFSRLGSELKPGMIWVTSGAAEIGRLDYIKRTGHELTCDSVDAKTDYAAQGQSILMEQYRHFIRQEYSVRQVLVEHQHFNDPEKREHIRRLFLRAKEQGAIPIVNYNDPVSDEENRKWELSNLRREHREVHECVDNDETAAVIAGLVTAKTLLIMTSTEGIYADPKDPKTLIRDVTGEDAGRDGAQNPRIADALHGRVPRGRERRACQAGICARPGDARHDGDYRPRPSPDQRLVASESGGRAPLYTELSLGVERSCMKANYHTHTARCGHADRHGRRNMCWRRLSGDLTSWAFRITCRGRIKDGYVHPGGAHAHQSDAGISGRACARWRSNTAAKIRILTGFECEYFPDYMGWLADMKAENGSGLSDSGQSLRP